MSTTELPSSNIMNITSDYLQGDNSMTTVTGADMIQSNSPKSDAAASLKQSTSSIVDYTETNDSMASDILGLRSNVLTATNFLIFVWFLGIFLIIYFLLMPNKSEGGRLINVILIVWLIYLCSYLYFQMSDYQKKHLYHTTLEWTQEYFNSDIELFILIILTIVFYILIYVLGVPMKEGEKPFMVGLLEDKFWILIFMFVVIYFFKIVFGININNMFFDWYYKVEAQLVSDSKAAKDKLYHTIVPTKSEDHEPPVVQTTPIAPVPAPSCSAASAASAGSALNEEVFNINDNLYSYSDAQDVCRSYGARLATYDDIEKAYNDGAEWCSYGWSDGQMAYFPTQKSTWQSLQINPRYKNNCGRPGVNGGYMGNPDLKFGVNCYGVKPKPKQADLDLMNARKQSPMPKSAADLAMEEKLNYWKNQNILINSFNTDKWSEY